MAEKVSTLSYARVSDLFQSPQKTCIIDEVRAEIREERKDSILDLCSIRRQEDWSYLADKTVGAEGE